MRGCIGFLLFLLMVAPPLFVFESLAAINSWLLDREFYADLLADPQIYPALLAGMMDEAGADGVLDAARFLEMTSLVDETEWHAAANAIVDQGLEVVAGDRTTMTIALPLSPLRALIAGQHSEVFIRSYVTGLRPCSGGIDPFRSSAAVDGVPLPLCFPADLTAAQYADQIAAQLPAIVENMPAAITFTGRLDADVVDFLQGFEARPTLFAATAMIGVIALGAWYGVGMLATNTRSGRLRWLGITLILPSFSVLLIGLALTGPFLPVFQSALISSAGAAGEAELLVYDVVFSNIGRVRTAFLVTGGIPVLLGVLMNVAGSRRRGPDAAVRSDFADQRPDTGLDGDHGKRGRDDVIRPL